MKRATARNRNDRRADAAAFLLIGAITVLFGGLGGSLWAEDKPPPPVAEGDLSIVWETSLGEPYCAYTAPELPQGFTFSDFARWGQTATDPPGLIQGDPSTLTWGFVPDGTAIGNGGCQVAGESTDTSDLIAFLDAIRDPASTGGTDLTQRLWFPLFEQIFTDWGLLNGVNYIYEPNDDGATLVSGGAGVLGTRADLRIGGHYIDGQAGSNVLACNYFPNNGDMIIDTGNTTFYSGTSNNSRGFRNVLAHEHGHGMGIRHVCPVNQTKLMEPFISTSFDGPQVDDVNAANRGYGDRDEYPGQNDTAGSATFLGAVPQSGVPVTRVNVSIDDNSDSDFYAFSVLAGSQATVVLSPTGSTYLSGPQNGNGSCSAGSNFNSMAQSDLTLEIRGQSGANVIASANAFGAGSAEMLTDIVLPEGAGTYFVRATGLDNKNQMYGLSVSTTAGSCATDAFEPDANSGQATVITAGVTKNHNICPVGDADWSTFTLNEDNAVVLETSGGAFPENTQMSLRNAAGGLIEFNDDIDALSNRHSKIDRLCGVDELPAGTYFVEVNESGNDEEIPSYALELTVTPCPCPPTETLASQTLSGTQTFQATGTATLGPALAVDGTLIQVQANEVSFLNDTEIGGTFSAGNTPACAP